MAPFCSGWLGVWICTIASLAGGSGSLLSKSMGDSSSGFSFVSAGSLSDDFFEVSLSGFWSPSIGVTGEFSGAVGRSGDEIRPFSALLHSFAFLSLVIPNDFGKIDGGIRERSSEVEGVIFILT